MQGCAFGDAGGREHIVPRLAGRLRWRGSSALKLGARILQTVVCDSFTLLAISRVVSPVACMSFTASTCSGVMRCAGKTKGESSGRFLSMSTTAGAKGDFQGVAVLWSRRPRQSTPRT